MVRTMCRPTTCVTAQIVYTLMWWALQKSMHRTAAAQPASTTSKVPTKQPKPTLVTNCVITLPVEEQAAIIRDSTNALSNAMAAQIKAMLYQIAQLTRAMANKENMHNGSGGSGGGGGGGNGSGGSRRGCRERHVADK